MGKLYKKHSGERNSCNQTTAATKELGLFLKAVHNFAFGAIIIKERERERRGEAR